RHHTFSVPGTGFFAAETAARNRPCVRPENERLKGRIGKARRQRAFSARLHMSAENVNAWWWMQPPSNRSLSLHLGQMQGDFRKMQGSGHRNLAKSHQISTPWVMLSLLKGAGKSRENGLCSAGWWTYARKVERGFFRACWCAQALGLSVSSPYGFEPRASPFTECQLDPWIGLNGCPFRKSHPAWESHRRVESSHDRERCSRSFIRSQCSSLTSSSPRAGLKPRTCSSAINSASP